MWLIPVLEDYVEPGVRASACSAPGNVTNLTITWPGATVAGDVAILSIACSNASLTDLDLDSWRLLGVRMVSSTFFVHTYARVCTGAESGSFGVTLPTTNRGSYALTVYYGVQLPMSTDVASGLSVDPAAVTRPDRRIAHTVIAERASSGLSTAFTPPAGYTSGGGAYGVSTGATAIGAAYSVTPVTGTIDPAAWTRDGTATVVTLTIALPVDPYASVVLVQSSTLTGDGAVVQAGAADLTQASTLTAGADVTVAGAAALSQSSTLTATGSVSAGSASAALTQGSTLTAAGSVTVPGGVALSQTSTFTAAGARTAPGSAALSQSSTLVAAGAVAKVSGAALTQTATLGATGSVASETAAALTQSSTLAAAGVSWAVLAGAAALSQSSTLTVAGVGTRYAAATITQTSALTAGATRTAIGSAALEQPSALAVGALVQVLAGLLLEQISTLVVVADVSPLADPPDGPAPAHRNLVVRAEPRVALIPAESRVFVVPHP